MSDQATHKSCHVLNQHCIKQTTITQVDGQIDSSSRMWHFRTFVDFFVNSRYIKTDGKYDAYSTQCQPNTSIMQFATRSNDNTDKFNNSINFNGHLWLLFEFECFITIKDIWQNI